MPPTSNALNRVRERRIRRRRVYALRDVLTGHRKLTTDPQDVLDYAAFIMNTRSPSQILFTLLRLVLSSREVPASAFDEPCELFSTSESDDSDTPDEESVVAER